MSFASPVNGSPEPDAGPILAPGQKVRITLRGRNEPSALFGSTKVREEGIFSGSTERALGITQGKATEDTVWIDRASVLKLEISYGEERHPYRGAFYGMAIGFVGGFVAAAIEAESCKGEFLCGASYLLFPPAGAAGGLFIGAVVGTFAKTEGWTTIPEREYDIGLRLGRDRRTELAIAWRF